jgi:hypothetical protein
MSRSHSDHDHTADEKAPAEIRPEAPPPVPPRVPLKLLLDSMITAIANLAAQVPGGHGNAPMIAELRRQLAALRD